MISWPVGVRQTILRDTQWTVPVCTIADETRCGRKKVRVSNTLQPTTFNVSIRMTIDEAKIFINWYRGNCRNGAESFLFPRIDDITGTNELVEYRISPNTNVEWDNPSGLLTTCKMQWEEV